MGQSGSEETGGTTELTFSLTNKSANPCTMKGYPGLELLGQGGTAVPITPVQGGGLAFENLAVTTVSLAPQKTAFFNAGYSEVVPEPAATCSTVTSAEITPPTAGTKTQEAVSGLSLHACVGGGTLHVSPVFGSTDVKATATTAPVG